MNHKLTALLLLIILITYILGMYLGISMYLIWLFTVADLAIFLAVPFFSLRRDDRLGILKRLQLQLSGYVYMGHRYKEGWKEPISHYAFKCPKHGIIIDYPHGYNQRLECPQCREEKKQEKNLKEESH